ncbi:MAG: DOMON-like domain-containing protein [Sphingobium sp.]|nr:DOMON-like domain-containing protein [Sphingobium sp.]
MNRVLELICHADSPNKTPLTITVVTEQGQGAGQTLHYRLRGAVGRIMLPELGLPRRGHELWQTTCFELFVQRTGEQGYREYNFAASGEWAAYDFTGYRAGMKEADTPAPEIISVIGPDFYDLSIYLPDALPTGRIGLSAIIEEQNGAKSYWALAHAPGKPDFHHPTCFAQEVTAPEQA